MGFMLPLVDGGCQPIPELRSQTSPEAPFLVHCPLSPPTRSAQCVSHVQFLLSVRGLATRSRFLCFCAGGINIGWGWRYWEKVAQLNIEAMHIF